MHDIFVPSVRMPAKEWRRQPFSYRPAVPA
eukprot:COSAG01_NODE_4421_length_5039_cov_29.208097_1_plen_29_part_10